MDPFGSGELRLLAPVAVLQAIEPPTPAFSGLPSNAAKSSRISGST